MYNIPVVIHLVVMHEHMYSIVRSHAKLPSSYIHKWYIIIIIRNTGEKVKNL